ncbi:MAG: penicillin-binding protein 1B [Pseudomonadota bacterium]
MAKLNQRAARSRRAAGRRGGQTGFFKTLWRWSRWPVLIGLAGLAFYMALLDRQITTAFEGRRWDVPARVYAQPTELYAGRSLSQDELLAHLDSLGYRRVVSVSAAGQFSVSRSRVAMKTRAFDFWDGRQPSVRVAVRFDGGRVASVEAGPDRAPIARLDPLMMGSLLPASREDRIVLSPEQVPAPLKAALVAVEDRAFYDHHGVDPKAVARAVVVNLKAGRMRQGGSTLTQQLVKNYFLTNERTLTRKVNEALMAVLLDARFDKRALMTGYVNEVFLGQDGARAVHGFALGAQFYFGMPLDELSIEHVALLVGLIKGPSYYDPRRHPERSKARRNLVLDVLAEQAIVDADTAKAAKRAELGVVARPGRAAGATPAYMDEVRAQLARDYAASDLNTVGLTVFTALDPFVQARAERIATRQLAQVERDTGTQAGTLQVGAVISDPDNGELLAVIGGRHPGFDGYNRAITLRRSVGSLVKPFVYLAAIESGDFHLASVLPDDPIEVALPNGSIWAPANLSDRDVGAMPLYRALAESVNRPAVHTGLALGVDAVARQLEAALPDVSIPRYASITLGAINLSPRQVAEAYGALATAGEATPLRAVRAVVDADGQPLKRYDLRLKGVARSASVIQILGGMRTVMTHGTGRRAAGIVPGEMTALGKSGSTNDYRDAWFAGFTGDRLAVVWVGRDDNAPIALGGARAALPIWAHMIRSVAEVPYEMPHDEQIVAATLDYATGMLGDDACDDTVVLPLPRTLNDLPVAPCTAAPGGRDKNNDGILPWLRDRLISD